MADKINKNTSGTIGGISPREFNKLTDEQKKIAIIGDNKFKTKRQEGGVLGGFFGTNTKNASIHIAFVICIVLLIFCGVDLVHSFLGKNKITSEMWNLIFPVVTLALGYIFGKGENKE